MFWYWVLLEYPLLVFDYRRPASLISVSTFGCLYLPLNKVNNFHLGWKVVHNFLNILRFRCFWRIAGLRWWTLFLLRNFSPKSPRTMFPSDSRLTPKLFAIFRIERATRFLTPFWLLNLAVRGLPEQGLSVMPLLSFYPSIHQHSVDIVKVELLQIFVDVKYGSPLSKHAFKVWKKKHSDPPIRAIRITLHPPRNAQWILNTILMKSWRSVISLT